jgi:hypothetical protein
MAFTPMNYMPDYGAVQETEEERRRRLEAEQLSGMPQAQPVSPQDFGAMPVQEQPMAATAPAEPTQPAAGELKMVNGRLQRVTEPEPVTLPEPGPGVQVAGPAQMPPSEPRYTGPSQGAEAQTVAQPQQPQLQPQQPQSQYSLSTGLGAPGLRAPAAQPAMAAEPGALTTTAAQQMFQDSQDDLDRLVAMRNDTNIPEYLRRRSGERAFELMSQQQQRQTAEQRAQQLIASGDGNAISNALKGRGAKGDEGNWLKMIMLGYLSPELARNEAMKLGLTPSKWETGILTDDKGAQVGIEIQRRADGKIIGGTRTDGTKLTPGELERAVVGAPSKLKPDVSMQDVEKDGQAGRVVTTYDAQNRPKTQVESGGKFFPYDSTWKPRSISTRMAGIDYQLVSDLSKKHKGNVMDMWKDYQVERGPQTPDVQQEFFQRYGYNQVPGGQQGTTTQQGNVVQQGTVTQQGNVVQQGGGAGQGGGARQGGGAGVGTTQGGVSTPIGQLQNQAAVNKRRAEERIQTGETIPREFIKLNSAAAAEAAKTAANAPALLATLDRITNTLERRPDFANSLQSPAFTAFVVAQDADKQKRLEDLSNVARIQPQDKTDFQNLVNDMRKLEVAGITQSGLTASQLNTERESQRVIDALSISLRNTPQAARAQAEIAKAQIQYQRRFAQYLASADPTQNPAMIRSRFDDTVGDKIYKDLAPKLEAIRRGSGVVDFRSPR